VPCEPTGPSQHQAPIETRRARGCPAPRRTKHGRKHSFTTMADNDDTLEDASSVDASSKKKKKKTGALMETSLSAWKPTLEILFDGLTDVWYKGHWQHGDDQGRTPPQIINALISAGAEIQSDMIEALEDAYRPPRTLLAAEMFEFFEYITRDEPRFARQNGSGGRVIRSSREDGTPTHAIYHLGGWVDGGLLHHLVRRRVALERRALMPPEDPEYSSSRLTADEIYVLFMIRAIEEYLVRTQRRFRQRGIEVVVWHFVVYFQADAVSLHLDLRLDSPLSCRGIMPLFTSRVRRGNLAEPIPA